MDESKIGKSPPKTSSFAGKASSKAKHLSNAEITKAFPGVEISKRRVGDAMKRLRDRAYWEREYKDGAAKRLAQDTKDTQEGIDSVCGKLWRLR